MVIVAGKGGVGKTVVTAALARAASLAGHSALVVEVEGSSGLGGHFGRPPLTYDEVELLAAGADGTEGWVRGRAVTADAALLEYLREHGLARVSKRLLASGVLDVVSTAAPGLRDILVLGKVKALEREGGADVVLLDAPAAGHAITFLLSARGLLDAINVGPINAQARDVLELLTDPSRCQVMLVALPEETPVNELVDTAFHLEDRVGVALGPVVVNALLPATGDLAVDPTTAAAEAGVTLRPGEADALAAAAAFRRDRSAMQAEQLARLAEALPLPQLHLPFLFSAGLGPAELDVLARALLDGLATVPAPAGTGG
ncbi:MAG: ArsA-related P-loop ATPase [Acidimicrobiales bacterium]